MGRLRSSPMGCRRPSPPPLSARSAVSAYRDGRPRCRARRLHVPALSLGGCHVTHHCRHRGHHLGGPTRNLLGGIDRPNPFRHVRTAPVEQIPERPRRFRRPLREPAKLPNYRRETPRPPSPPGAESGSAFDAKRLIWNTSSSTIAGIRPTSLDDAETRRVVFWLSHTTLPLASASRRPRRSSDPPAAHVPSPGRGSCPRLEPGYRTHRRSGPPSGRGRLGMPGSDRNCPRVRSARPTRSRAASPGSERGKRRDRRNNVSRARNGPCNRA